MRALRLPLVAVFVAGAFVLSHCGGGGDDTPGPSQLTSKTVSMNGAQVVPAVIVPAFGTGGFTIDMGSGAIQGTVFTTNVSGTAAHIHEAAVGANGAVVVTLEDGGGGNFRVPAGTMLTSSQLDSLKNGNLFVDVHTAANPNGEIRGQIGRTVFFSTLTPGQETPPTTSTASGLGVFVFDPESGTMSGTVTTSGVVGVASHMHIGAIGSPAAVAIPFTGGPSNYTMPPTVLTADQITSLGKGLFYANVHSAANPNGEVRGQLYIPVRVANLTGAQETPPNSSTGIGQGVFVVDPATRAVAGIETWQGVVGATDSHIHNSAGPGVAGGIVIRGTVTLGTSGSLKIASSAPLADNLFVGFMLNNLYYNVHSATFPSGEIRGQLSITP